LAENATHSLQHPAIVIGLSIHGLAIARALARHGVDVHCLAEVETPARPAVYTRHARVHFRRGLNQGPIASFLNDVADSIGSPHKIVLFPTSDRIAKGIANAWSELEARFLLSWSHCRELVLRLQRKDSLAEFCERAQVTYPRSRILVQGADAAAVVDGLALPLIVKPAQPLSAFKAIRVDDLAQLRQVVEQYPTELPFVVQEWIEGPEPSLYSCTSYLVHGKPLYLFTSRKLAAHPPGLGQGTVFETVNDPRTADMARAFLQQLDLSGPVAVEFKRDAAGRFWLIEPNIGRTEYCVDLAIQAGFDLPWLEFLHVTGGPVEQALPARTGSCVWFDTDKDPRCFVTNMKSLRDEAGQLRAAVFPFLGHRDWRPFGVSLFQQLGAAGRLAGRAAARLFGGN